jgi:hypothetical protein
MHSSEQFMYSSPMKMVLKKTFCSWQNLPERGPEIGEPRPEMPPDTETEQAGPGATLDGKRDLNELRILFKAWIRFVTKASSYNRSV